MGYGPRKVGSTWGLSVSCFGSEPFQSAEQYLVRRPSVLSVLVSVDRMGFQAKELVTR